MISSDLAEKLSKLLPMLGSDQDGEIANAARMIKKALAAEKLDFHDLTQAVQKRAIRAPSQAQPGTGPFNFANAFRESDNAAENTDPGMMTSRYGLPLHDEHTIHSWGSVASYCMKLNRTIPKRYGGKFLMDWQIKVLTQVSEGTWPNNATARMIETVLARCHQARDAQRVAEANGEG